MEKRAQFIRESSKEHSSEERQELAKQIKAKRAEYFTRKKRQEDIGSVVEGHELDLTEKVQRLTKLAKELEAINSQLFGKIRNFLRLGKIKAESKATKQEKDVVELELESAQIKAEDINFQPGSEDAPDELQEVRDQIERFYQDQEEMWSSSEYSREDVEKYFTEEYLSSLDTDEYALLLRRFSGSLVSHVTRQGVRDHVGHDEHTASLDTKVDGFKKILEEGRLRAPLTTTLVEGAKDEAVLESLRYYLQLDNEDGNTREKALELLDGLMKRDPGFDSNYADHSAVHFAINEVADTYYGSESKNEIFFAYPSELIASQYYFNTHFDMEGWGNRNDLAVWANEERGIDINIGLVFIPKDTLVSPETGSRYELDENEKPSINQEAINEVKRIVLSSEFSKLEQVPNTFKEVEKKLKISNSELTKVIFDLDFFEMAQIFNKRFHETQDKQDDEDPELNQIFEGAIERGLRNQGILFETASRTVTAQEYWEAYFKKYPDQRPSKIIYYEGQDPTRALKDWKSKNNIIDKDKKADLGFPERLKSSEDPEPWSGSERFRSIAEKIIDDYFKEEDAAIAEKELVDSAV